MKNCVARKRLLAAACLLLAAGAAGAAGAACAQAGYPNRPIRMIVPYAPGGSNDIMGRLVAQKLSDSFGVPVVVDNRGGGHGIIGAEAVARSTPDGHTILVTSLNAHLTTALLMKTPYDPVKDYAAVGTIDASDYLMVVHAALPASTLQEFVALARSKPGRLNYASSSTFLHVTTEMFALRTGIRMQHVPYKGAGPAVNDLLGGQVQMFFSTPSSMIAHVKSGRLKPLAITSEKRLPALPQVPTFSEAGVRDFQATALRGVLMARGTPKPIIERLSRELAKITALPDLREKLEAQGMAAHFLTPEQLGARMTSDAARFAQTVKAMEITGAP